MKKEVFEKELSKRYEREDELDKRFGKSYKDEYIRDRIENELTDDFKKRFWEIEEEDFEGFQAKIDYIVENSDVTYESVLENFDEKLDVYEDNINEYFELIHS